MQRVLRIMQTNENDDSKRLFGLLCNGVARNMKLSLKEIDNKEYYVEYYFNNITHIGDIGEKTEEYSHWLIS